MSDTDNLFKIQRVVNLLDSTFKMLTMGIALKNSLKKEFSKDDKKDKDSKQTNQQNSTENQNQTNQPSTSTQNLNHIINKNSFKDFLNKY